MIRPPPRNDFPSPPSSERISPTLTLESSFFPWNSQKAVVARLAVRASSKKSVVPMNGSYVHMPFPMLSLAPSPYRPVGA